MKSKVVEDFLSRKTTINKAAENAGLTVWEMEQYLVAKGFKSQYSVEDLKEEISKIEKKYSRRKS